MIMPPTPSAGLVSAPPPAVSAPPPTVTAPTVTAPPPPVPPSLSPCQAHLISLIVLSHPIPSLPLLPPLPPPYTHGRLPYSTLVNRLTSKRGLNFLTVPELKSVLRHLKTWYHVKISGNKKSIIEQIMLKPIPILEDSIHETFQSIQFIKDHIDKMSEEVVELMKVPLPLTDYGLGLISAEIVRLGGQVDVWRR
ncbi:hypothetical protein TrST_g12102 [Triparma strigata]|uniref:Uncharacterized protein n=1 Tax=Triparma strigata TaxID=1606541 RepID=A0A9W7EDR3_9STRA|nr:hypothetical protein TrST_g12102 [Triparma strigata]